MSCCGVDDTSPRRNANDRMNVGVPGGTVKRNWLVLGVELGQTCANKGQAVLLPTYSGGTTTRFSAGVGPIGTCAGSSSEIRMHASIRCNGTLGDAGKDG